MTHSQVISLLRQPERLLSWQGGPQTFRITFSMAATASSQDSINTHSAQEILENMTEAVPFNSTGLTPPAIQDFPNPNPTLLCLKVYDADVVANSE